MDACAAAESPRAGPSRGWRYRPVGGAGMSGGGDKSSQFVPDLSAVFQELSESLRGWANALGIEADCYDDRIQEGGSNAWGDQLQKATDGGMKTAVSLLTACGQLDVAADLRQRFEELYTQGQGYQQRLEAMEDQRRVHVDGLVAQYRQAFDDDPGEARLWALCKGPQRAWTLRMGGKNPLETPAQFAEAIDKASWEQQGGKLKAQAEMKRAALDMAEHIELLAAVAQAGQARQQDQTKQEMPKRGKRGPARMPLTEAWRYLTIVQEWAGIQESNRKLPLRDRVQKVQLAEKHDITTRELDAMLAWYAKHLREGRFPKNPRTLSRGELEKWFE